MLDKLAISYLKRESKQMHKVVAQSPEMPRSHQEALYSTARAFLSLVGLIVIVIF